MGESMRGREAAVTREAMEEHKFFLPMMAHVVLNKLPVKSGRRPKN